MNKNSTLLIQLICSADDIFHLNLIVELIILIDWLFQMIMMSELTGFNVESTSIILLCRTWNNLLGSGKIKYYSKQKYNNFSREQ